MQNKTPKTGSTLQPTVDIDELLTHYNDNNDNNYKAEEIFLVKKKKKLGKSHSLMHGTKPGLVFHAGGSMAK